MTFEELKNNLPKIEGKSEKQIKFAEDLRAKLLNRVGTKDCHRLYEGVVGKAPHPVTGEIMTPESLIAHVESKSSKEEYPMRAYVTVRNSSDARKIIDACIWC